MKNGVAFLLLGAVTLAQALQPQRTLSGKICHCNPSEATVVCSQNGSDGELVVHENCNQFYKCFDGKAIPFFCPSDLLYNPLAEKCDWPYNVECESRPIVEEDDVECSQETNDEKDEGTSGEIGGSGESGNNNDGNCNCNPEEAPGICASDGSDGVLVAHENCNQFYKCDHGVPVVLSCNGILVYNPYTEQCDWPEKVECGDRPIVEIDNGNGEGGSSGGNGDNGNGNEDDGNGNNGSTGTCNCNPGEAPGICAAEGSDNVLVAHENCNQFFKCDHGVPVVFTCSGVLLYNPQTEQCDWPEKVDCGDRPIVEIDNGNGEDGSGSGNGDNGNGNEGDGNGDNGSTGTCNCNPGEAPGICAAEGSNNVLVAHENCNQFFKCDHGVPVVFTCSGDLLYNPHTERCDWPEKVECGDRPIVEIDNGNGEGGSSGGNGDNGDGNEGNGNGDNGSTGTCNCNPGEAPGICAAEGSDNVLVAHENCNQFFKCDHGVPVVFTCSGDLLYNPQTEQCDWPEKVDCGDRPIVEIDNGNGEDGSGSGNGDNGNGNEGDGNGDNGSTGTCNCNPGEAPGICAAEGSDNVLVAHENCNQFFKCDHGVPVVFTCSGDLLYNPQTEQCDWPEKVECGDRPIVEIDNGNGEGGSSSGNGDNGDGNEGNGNGDNGSTGTCNCNPGEAPGICAAEGSDNVLVAHENCNQFFKCDHGVPVVFTCSGDLLYNPQTEQCDWPEKVECGDRPIVEIDNGNGEDGSGSGNGDNGNGNEGDGNGDNGSTGTCNCNPGEAPGICAAEGSDNVLVAHENCNQFFKCDHGVPVVFTCSGVLLYNPHTERCDWPEKVDCGDRPIVEIDNGNGGGGSSGGNGDNGDGNEGNGNGDNGSTGTCNCNPGEAPGICAAEGSDNVLVAHENCNQFFKCDHGVPVVFTCSGVLLYNPQTEQCDWPEKVDCGDRPIVEIDNGNGEGGSGGGNGDNGDGNEGDGNGDNGSTGTCNCNPGEAPGICEAEGSDNVLVAHENCNQFFKCDHGVPVVFTCSGVLLYNPHTERCDWPEKVDCGDRPIVEIDNGNGEGGSSGGNGDNGNGNEDDGNGDNGSTGTCNCNPDEAPGICAAEGSDNVLVAHENCNQLFKCDHGVPVVFTCSGVLLYNPHTERCDWPEKVDCGDRPIVEIDNGNGEGGSSGGNGDNGNGNEDDGNGENGSTGTCNCNPGEAPGICAAEGSDNVLVAHENCNQFFKCNHGVPVVFTCSGDLLYNPHTERCDWPEKVDCGDRPIVEIDGGGNDNSGNGDNNETGIGGEDSENGGNGETCNCNPEDAPAICINGNSEGILIAHEQCNKYYKCSFGSPVAIKCPDILLYNPVLEVCDWPQNVECGDRVIPEEEDGNNSGDNNDNDNDGNDSGSSGPFTDPSEAPAICQTAGHDGILVAHESCDKFYVCSDGLPVALQCPSNLLYNPSIEQCDWPRNVECDNRTVPEAEVEEDSGTCLCYSKEAPSICAGSDSTGKMIAHENCNQFYVCFNGKPIARSCPSSLFYEPHSMACKWPAAVNCEGRDVTAHLSLNKHMQARRGIF